MAKYTRKTPRILEANRSDTWIPPARAWRNDKKLGRPNNTGRAWFGDLGSYRWKYACVSFQDLSSKTNEEPWSALTSAEQTVTIVGLKVIP